MQLKFVVFLILYVVILFSFQSLKAQNHEAEHEHDHQANELSFAIGAAMLTEEKEFAPAIHIHYIRGFGEHKRFGLGIAAETILDEHKHYSLALATHIVLYKGLVLGYSPGILVAKEGDTYHKHFAQHVEIAYEFELGRFHLGPLFELGFEKEGTHYMLGVHCGLGF